MLSAIAMKLEDILCIHGHRLPFVFYKVWISCFRFLALFHKKEKQGGFPSLKDAFSQDHKTLYSRSQAPSFHFLSLFHKKAGWFFSFCALTEKRFQQTGISCAHGTGLYYLSYPQKQDSGIYRHHIVHIICYKFHSKHLSYFTTFIFIKIYSVLNIYR